MKTIALTLLVSATSAASAAPTIEVSQALLAAAPGPASPLILPVAAASYVDGTYTGPTIDAYWGLVQVQALVQNGRVVSLKMLHYPSDRRTSFYISQNALPLLRDEVVRSQTSSVNIISGATLTSEAFIRSLGGALSQAHGSGAAPTNPPGF